MRYCSKCGNKLEDDQLYCPKCGNKEPFLKDDKNSSWKEFDQDVNKDGNVNYDFKTPEVRISQPELSKNKHLNNLGRALRIYDILLCIYCIVTFIVSIVIEANNKEPIALSITTICLVGVEAILVAALIIASFLTKSYNVAYKNAFVSCGVLGFIMVAMAIAQYFIVKYQGFSPMDLFLFMLSLGSNVMLSQVYSFKKTA